MDVVRHDPEIISIRIHSCDRHGFVAALEDITLKRKMTKVLPANFTTDFADFD
jgi:hypothetical protein